MRVQRQLQLVDEDSPPTGIKVAFATSDLRVVDQHFGSAERFAVYRVEPGRATLVKVAEFGQLARDGNEDKLMAKFRLLDDCVAVYCHAVGASAVRQLVSLGVQPVKVQAGSTIAALVGELQGQLRNGSEGWLQRIMQQRRRRPDDRFEQMDAEGWDE